MLRDGCARVWHARGPCNNAGRWPGSAQQGGPRSPPLLALQHAALMVHGVTEQPGGGGWGGWAGSCVRRHFPPHLQAQASRTLGKRPRRADGIDGLSVGGARPGGRTVDVAKLQKLVKDQGFLIDGGYGKIKGTTFRLSNMGDETIVSMTPLIAALDEAIKLL